MSNRNEADSAGHNANIGVHVRNDEVTEPDAISLQHERRRSYPDVAASTYHVNSLGVVLVPLSSLPSVGFTKRAKVVGKALQTWNMS